MKYKDIIYSISCLLFTIIIGGAAYEHFAVVPRWSIAPPASLAMFQGQYGLNAAAFWALIHPVTMILLIASLITTWKSERRINILSVLIPYLIILAVTAMYFVPELVEITSTPYSDSIDSGLTKRARLWENLSVVRLIVLIILSLILFLGLTKNNQTIIPDKRASR